MAFVGLFLDWRLKIAFSLIMVGLYVTAVNTISNLDQKAGFYCADWFELNSFAGLLLSLELIVLLLLLIQAYFLYTNFKSSDLVF